MLKDREHELLKIVSSEFDDKGKPKFSNAELRAGEVNARLKTDTDAATIRGALKGFRDQRDALRVDIEKTVNKFSATKHRSTLYASWLGFQASHS